MRRPFVRLRAPLRGNERGAAASIGTVLLVVLVVAMVTIVGLYVFTLVRIPDEPPDVKVNFSQVNDRWTVSFTYSREDVPFHQLRLIARTSGLDYVTYDSDGDGLRDALMVASVDTIAVTTGDGPQVTPMVLVDADGDGNLSVGDSIVVYEVYYFPAGTLMDADRGYAYVGPNPDGIPRNSTLQVVASPLTLGSSDINPGDTVRVEIKRGATLMATREGPASASGTYIDDLEVLPGWATGSYDAIFTIRPGEIDEWHQTYTFRVLAEAVITSAERDLYYNTTHPLAVGDVISLVHIPSNQVVLEFRL